MSIQSHMYDNNITVEEASNVLSVFMGEGICPGSFTESLILTISKADSFNASKLSLSFPGLVKAVLLYKNDVNGVDVLRDIASK